MHLIELNNFFNEYSIPKKVNCGVFWEWNIDIFHKIGYNIFKRKEEFYGNQKRLLFE